MLQDERHRLILDTVSQEGKITVPEICEMFDVSEMTARRDLRMLDRKGLLRRVHGGAVSSLGRSYEPPFNIRMSQAHEAKIAIGKAAAGMVVDGESIALDVGTTTLEIASALRDKHNLTIVTASLPIANEIVANFSIESDVRLILSGGIIRPREFSMIGHIAEQTFEELFVDKAFIGVGGLDLKDGLTEYNMEDALVKRPLLNSAREKIVVAEGAKLGRTTFVTVGPVSAIDVVVTDECAPSDVIAGLRETGIKVVIVDAKDPEGCA